MKTPPPILASEVLREDLAPIEPGRTASRWWDGGAAIVFLAVAVSLRFGFGVTTLAPQAASVCLAAAAAAAATAVVPLPYLWRAVVGAVVGTTIVALGFFQAGPLALLTSPGSSPWVELARVIACVALPAAFLFRSHYRAYQRGRALLAGSFVLSAPFIIYAAAGMLTGPSIARLGATCAMTGTLLGIMAFTPAPTTVVTAWCGQTLTALLALDIGLRQLYLPAPAGAGPFALLLTAVTFFGSVAPISLGLFQVFAAMYAPDARKIDVHKPSQVPDEAPVPLD